MVDDHVAYAAGHPQHLTRGDAAPSRTWDETLGNDLEVQVGAVVRHRRAPCVIDVEIIGDTESS